MALEVAKTLKERPSGKRGGRTESPEWAELAEAIKAQKPGEYVVYKKYEGTKAAVNAAQRIRSKSLRSFEGLQDKVRVALTDTVVEKDPETGKERTVAGTMALCYDPKGEFARTGKGTAKASK
jgi:hypothetical protein